MANDKLEAFLASEAGENKPAAPAPEPQQAPKPEPQQSPPEEKKEPVAPPEPAHEPDDDEPPRDARPGEVAVPRQAYEAERNRRQNWVERASRAEARIEEMEKRLAELSKPPPAPPPQQQQPPPFQWIDPNVDPIGHYEQRLGHLAFNMSENNLRYRVGDEAADKLMGEFTEMAASQPHLWQQIKQQGDPFRWLEREVERQRLLRDVGSDPAAYRAKLRAEWEAEQAAKQPPPVQLPQNTPAPHMPPSLAAVRSAAPRGAPQWSGPLNDQQFAADMRERRMAQRRG